MLGPVGYWTDWSGEWHSPVILKQTTVRGSDAARHCWFLELTPSAPLKWEHCRWWFTQVTGVSLLLTLFLDLHCCWWASWQECNTSLTHSPQKSLVVGTHLPYRDDKCPMRRVLFHLEGMETVHGYGFFLTTRGTVNGFFLTTRGTVNGFFLTTRGTVYGTRPSLQ